MSIANYVFPQTRLYQYLTKLSQPSDVLRSPVVVGARYRLSRFGKETVPTTAYAAQADDQVLPFTFINATGGTSTLPLSEKIDPASVKVHGDKLEATLDTCTDAHIKVPSAAQANIIQLTNEELFRKTGETGTLHTEFHGRNAQVGDLVYVTAVSGGTPIRRTVAGFIGKDLDSDYGDFQNSDSNPLNAATSSFEDGPVPSGHAITCTSPDAFRGLTQGAFYNGYYGEEFTFKVITPGDNTHAVVTVTSASGKFSGTLTSTAGVDANHFKFSGAAVGNAELIIDADTATSLTLNDTYAFVIEGKYERLSDSIVVSDGDYTGTVNTTYTVEIIEGVVSTSNPAGAVIRISDSANLNQVQEITLANGNPIDLGDQGLTVDFALVSTRQGGLRKGDVYYVEATAATKSSTEFDKIVLNGPAVNTTTFLNFNVALNTVEFRVVYTGYIASNDEAAWSSNATEVTIYSNLTLEIAGRDEGFTSCAFVDGVGKLALSYRALQPAAAGADIILIQDSADITTQLGTVDIDNDVAFAASECFSGAQGLTTYVLLVADQTVAAYNDVLKKIRFRRNAYAITPVTEDTLIIDAVVAHCEAMSIPTKKYFRRCYYGVDSPGEYSVLTSYDDASVTATITDYLGAGKLFVSLTNADIQIAEYGLQLGDFIKVTATGAKYEIAEITETNHLVLVSGPDDAISVPTAIELWRANTADSQADFVRASAKARASRRAVQVWTDHGKRYIGTNLTVIPNKYIAAHVAGLRCALPKQRGLTRTEITSVTDCAGIYLRYSTEQLDAIAADGTFIVTQDAESGLVYVRHQLTTDVNNGSLAYEDNVGIIVDELSFKTDDVVSSYIGVKNMTDETLIDLKNALSNLFTTETVVPNGSDYGPSLIRFEGLKIVPDQILKDRAKILCKWIVPLPFNIGDIYITVDQDATLAPQIL